MFGTSNEEEQEAVTTSRMKSISPRIVASPYAGGYCILDKSIMSRRSHLYPIARATQQGQETDLLLILVTYKCNERLRLEPGRIYTNSFLYTSTATISHKTLIHLMNRLCLTRRDMDPTEFTGMTRQMIDPHAKV